MTRSVWKGPYVAVSLLQDVIALARKHPDWWSKGRFQGVKAPDMVNTQSRASTVLPDFLGCKFGVHNGKSYVGLEVVEAMVGHKFGEFAPTRVQAVHKKKDANKGKKINPKTGKS